MQTVFIMWVYSAHILGCGSMGQPLCPGTACVPRRTLWVSGCVGVHELCIFWVLWVPVVHLPNKGKTLAIHSKENNIGLSPAQVGQLGWLQKMQRLCNLLWAVSVLNYIIFPQKPQEFFNRPTHKLIVIRGRHFKMGGVNFSATSACKGILFHPRLGEHLISSLFCRGCNHLEFLSAFFPCAFYFYFVLLSLALFYWKGRNTFLENRTLKMLKNGERRYLLFSFPVSFSLIHFLTSDTIKI